MFSLIPNKTNIDFVGKRHIGFLVSTCLVLLGFYGAYMLAAGKAKLGVDFGGGANLTVILKQPSGVQQLRQALGAGFQSADIQQVEGGNTFFVRMPVADGQTADALMQQVKDSVAKSLAPNSVAEGSVEYVGPVVQQQLWQKAVWAIAVSLLCILGYIALRFDFRFGIGALIATFHDVLAVLGLMVVTGHEFSLLVVTALLTLAGYSLTDTVVVFDRIRENLKARRTEPMAKVVNDSINETLSRTINTSMATMVTVVVLYFCGGAVVHSFSLALILGIVVGTYSSIFVASPVVVEWNLRSPAKR
ncbi:MAG TPA: protein translocase subunit SecF [bacterium]|jgi:preprotein translocase subunit SecF|nr:protein translocase subunit SecF [bacterium]